MKLIKPAEIAAKIMTLIDEAEKELVIVSPYNKIVGWTKLINRIKKAQLQGVDISWYTRKNNVDSNNIEEVRSIGIEPVLVDDLHAKIYMNEEHAIFTSMNMSKTSDEKSIDLGYITEDKTEYDELYNAFLKHIKSKIISNKFKEQNVIAPGKTIANNVKYQRINSNEYYIKVIHEHIYRNYGAYEYRYKREEVLEYFNFINHGYKLQFIPYSQAIRIHIYLPTSEVIGNFEKRIYSNIEYNKLHEKSELEFCFDDNQNYVKYYFEKYDQKLNYWRMDIVNEFLKNLDILVNIIYK